MAARPIEINGQIYVKQPGPARSYVNLATGAKISRRQIDKLRTKQGAIKKRSEEANAKVRNALARSKAEAKSFQKRVFKETGEKITIRQAQSSERRKNDTKLFNKLYDSFVRSGGKEAGWLAAGATEEDVELLKFGMEDRGWRDGIPHSTPLGDSSAYRAAKLKGATGHRNKG